MSNDTGVFSFEGLIGRICARPKMYTMNGTFGEVAAFLEGTARGLVTGDPGLGKEMWIGGPVSASEWVEFSFEWLPQRLQYSQNYIWWVIIWQHYPDDQTALAQLNSLYLEFKAERDPQRET